MIKNKGLQLVDLLTKDSVETATVALNGDGANYYFIRPSYTGFVSYQISDPASGLSGSLAVNLEMSNDGETWLQATDAAGEDITGEVIVGGSYMEKLSDVNPAIKFRLALVTAVTGELKISTRV